MTYYVFNDAMYEKHNGDVTLKYDDYSYPDWGRWPDPKGMVDRMHDEGLKCILWQIPVLKKLDSILHLQNNLDHDHAIRNGYVVRNRDTSPYEIAEDWFKGCYVLDFTNVDARDWWFDKRRYLVEELGVDGFKTDGGECIFGRELLFHDGRNGEEMRNEYSNLYIKSYYDFLNSGGNEGITFSRSGYTGAQKAPAHWAGDERSTFDAFKRSLLAGLSSGLSGISFWGWDLAGFSGDVPTDELYARSAAMACFCPIMQYHAESKGEFNQDRTPWNIAERSGNDNVIAVYRHFAKLRMNLIPYIYQEAIHASATGEPIMRAMVLDFGNDMRYTDVYDTYMFGRQLLVAPVIEEGATSRKIELPKGSWYDLFTGKAVDGNKTIERDVEWDEIPVYVRDGSALPVALNDEMRLGRYDGNDLDDYPVLGIICLGDSVRKYLKIDGKGEVALLKQGKA